MKNKLKHLSDARETSPLNNIQTCESFQAAKSSIMDIGGKWKTFNQAHLENFILSEFDIDSETMEEHIQELLKYLMHNQLIDKIPHNGFVQFNNFVPW